MRKSLWRGAAGVVAALCLPFCAQAADSFYLDLLRDGRLAYDRGDYRAASRDLRLACFGFLEEPDLLAEGLARLALAQAATGDRDGFGETFRRLLEVEERFSIEGRSKLPAELGQALEERVLTWIPRESLADSSYASLVVEKLKLRLLALPPKRRAEELERRISQEPDNLTWHVLLAQLDLEERRTGAALDRAQGVLEIDPKNDEALCVRGAGRADGKDCTRAVEDLERCSRSGSEPAYVLALLKCQLALGQVEEAKHLVAALPEPVGKLPTVTKLARRLARAQPARAEGRPDASLQEKVTQPAAGSENAIRLAEARGILAAASSTVELDEAMALAKPIADDNPRSRDAQHLVAEIAYRARRWGEAVSYFERGGRPNDDQPSLLFYLAVSLYESGQRTSAAQVLERCLPSLPRSEYVKYYVDKIIGSS